MTVTVHILSSPQEFPADALARHPHLTGYAYPTGDVYVLGQYTPWGIDLDALVLGHEIQHVLSWQTGEIIINPDRF